MQESISHHLLKIHGTAHKVNELHVDDCQNAQTRAALAVLMEKNEETSVSKAHLYTKIEEEKWLTTFLFAAAMVAYSNRSLS